MNICFMSHFLIDPLLGGIERVSYNLVREFIGQGHTVVCVYSQTKGTSPEDFVEQLQLPDPEHITDGANVEFLHGILSKYDIDIIINQAHYAHEIHALCMGAKKDTRAKLVTVFHNAPDYELKVMDDYCDYIKFSGTGKLSTLYKFARRKVMYSLLWRRSYEKGVADRLRREYDESDATVLLSERFEDKFASLARLRDTDKLYAVGNPIMPVTPPSGPRANQILFVARMTYLHKRVDRMLEIWAEVWRDYPDWKLFMIGGGDDDAAAQIYAYAEKLGLENIVFTGTADPEPYYREAKILCLTSTYEGFGMVLVEAQQNGCVPIAYDSYEALSDIVDDGENGFKVRAFSKRQFVRKLRRLMDDAALRERMSKRGLETVRKFDAGAIAGQWIELFGVITGQTGVNKRGNKITMVHK